MTPEEQRLLDQVRAQLSSQESSRAVVYLDDTPRRAGDRVEIADAVIEVPWDARIAFVDLEPGVNWGHKCRYIAVRVKGDEVVSVRAQMPPFLKAGAMKFRFLWRGPAAPEWAVEGGAG
jgi:hypothetical protein